jgi:hypothetical protein
MCGYQESRLRVHNIPEPGVFPVDVNYCFAGNPYIADLRFILRGFFYRYFRKPSDPVKSGSIGDIIIVLLNKVPAYLFKAHSLIKHIDSIGNLGRGILHLGDCIYGRKFMPAIFAVIVLNIFVFAVFDYMFGMAIFTFHILMAV